MSLLRWATKTAALIILGACSWTATHAAAPIDWGCGADPACFLPAARRTLWNPGLNAVGGIPARTRICATLAPGGGNDGPAIQKALDGCPHDQVVALGPGDYRLTETLFLRRSKVTLRGAGRSTRLLMPEGVPYAVVVIGTRWFKYTQPVDLASDSAKDSREVTLVEGTRLSPPLTPGELVTVDEETDPELTWWSERSPPGHDSRGWSGRFDRPIGQVLEVEAVKGRTVTFTSPLHSAFRKARRAQLVRFSRDQDGPVTGQVRYTGLEDLLVSGGGGGDGGGNIRIDNAAYSWVKRVESERQQGASVAISGSFRCVLRDSYLHSTRDPNPGGGGYGVSLNQYSSDNLVENNVVWNFNKVMVMRTTGGGNVVAYNYMQDGYGAGYPTIAEVGLNASHLTTPHMELFEGNESWNFDSDSVWGNSVYITVFRNRLTGRRVSAPPLKLTDAINRRAAGLTIHHWWYSFLGNVLGEPDQSPARAFTYEVTRDFSAAREVPMWKLGYDGTRWGPEPDEKVLLTTIRHGNFDYATRKVVWDPGLPGRALPPSLYLDRKPDFLGDAPWPLVDPERETKVGTLPARARFEALHPRQ